MLFSTPENIGNGQSAQTAQTGSASSRLRSAATSTSAATSIPAANSINQTTRSQLAYQDLCLGRAFAIQYLKGAEYIDENTLALLDKNPGLVASLSGATTFTQLELTNNNESFGLQNLIERLNAMCGSTLAHIPLSETQSLVVNFAELRAQAIRSNPEWPEEYQSSLWTRDGFSMAVLLDLKLGNGWFNEYFNTASNKLSSLPSENLDLLNRVSLKDDNPARQTAVQIESIFVLSGRNSNWLKNCLDSYLDSLYTYGHKMPTVYVLHEGEQSEEAKKLAVLAELKQKYECNVLFVGSKEKQSALEILKQNLAENPDNVRVIDQAFKDKVLGAQRNWAHILSGGKPYSVIDDDSFGITYVPSDTRLENDNQKANHTVASINDRIISCWDSAFCKATSISEERKILCAKAIGKNVEAILKAPTSLLAVGKICDIALQTFDPNEVKSLYPIIKAELTTIGNIQFVTSLKDGEISAEFIDPLNRILLEKNEYDDPESNGLIILPVDVFGFHYNHIGQRMDSFPYISLSNSVAANAGNYSNKQYTKTEETCRAVDSAYCGKEPGGTFRTWNNLVLKMNLNHFASRFTSGQEELKWQLARSRHFASVGGQPLSSQSRDSLITTTVVTIDGQGLGLMRPGVLDSKGSNQLVKKDQSSPGQSVNCGLNLSHDGATRVFGQLDIGTLGKKLFEEILYCACFDSKNKGREIAIIELTKKIINFQSKFLAAEKNTQLLVSESRAAPEQALFRTAMKMYRQGSKAKQSSLRQKADILNQVYREVFPDIGAITEDLAVLKKVYVGFLKESGLSEFKFDDNHRYAGEFPMAGRNAGSKIEIEQFKEMQETAKAIRYLSQTSGKRTNREILERALDQMIAEIELIDQRAPDICTAAMNLNDRIRSQLTFVN